MRGFIRSPTESDFDTDLPHIEIWLSHHGGKPGASHRYMPAAPRARNFAHISQDLDTFEHMGTRPELSIISTLIISRAHISALAAHKFFPVSRYPRLEFDAFGELTLNFARCKSQ